MAPPKESTLPSNRVPNMIALGFAAMAAAYFVYGQSVSASSTQPRMPAQAVLLEPSSFAVLGNEGLFRPAGNEHLLNPTNTTPPFLQVFHKAFLSDILGPDAFIVELASNDTFAFAHEAPIWVPDTNRLYFSSNNGGRLGNSGLEKNNVVSFIDLDEVQREIAANGKEEALNVAVTPLSFPDSIQMTNGGTGPHQGTLLLVNSGRGLFPPTIALVDPNPPHNTTVLLDNFFGRQFNALNDVKVHPRSKNIFFTDVTYGPLLGFRPPPHLPNQVYRLDPKTKAVRVVADGFDKCNGIAFSADGRTAYIADTGSHEGLKGVDETRPATIYAFDVDPRTEAFINRRVFAFVDTGVPDGIQVDRRGNVYSGCGDGVHVWDPMGTLLGKFFVGQVAANMVFAADGNLLILAETKVFLAKIGDRKSVV